MEDEIARTEMIGLFPDKREVSFIARVGRPFQMPGGDWGCPAAIDGLYGSLRNVYGVDGIQAISGALSLIYQLLSAFKEKEGRLIYPEDRTDIPLEALFGRGETKE